MARRARTSTAKDARRQGILAAAAALFAEHRYAAVSMAEVARRAGVAKGTPYLYFATKEALFLHLFSGHLEAWSVALTGPLAAVHGPDAVGETLAKSLLERPILVRLLGLLHGTLEHNVAQDEILAFKQHLGLVARVAAAALEAQVPVPAGQGGVCLQQLLALVVGLAQMSDPLPAVLAVLMSPDLAHLQVDFPAALTTGLQAVLRGYVRAGVTG